MLFLIVNNPKDVVNISLSNEYYTVGGSVNVTCMASVYQLDLDLSLPIATTATLDFYHNNNIIKSNEFDIDITNSLKLIFLNISFINLNLSNSGIYKCSYIRKSNVPFVRESNSKSFAIGLKIKCELYLFYYSFTCLAMVKNLH